MTFDQHVADARPKVYNMALRLSRNREDAQDLTQEAFVRAFQGFDKYENDRPFENWIFRIVTRLYLDLRRNRDRRIKTVSLDDQIPDTEDLTFEPREPGPNPEELLMAPVLSEGMERAIGKLKPDTLRIIESEAAGLPYAEIADGLGVPQGTVRSRLFRARKALVRELMTL